MEKSVYETGEELIDDCQASGFPEEEQVAVPWGHEAPRFEGKDDQLHEHDLSLEAELFSFDERPSRGENFSSYNDLVVEVNIETLGSETAKPIAEFHQAKLHEAMLQNIKRCAYEVPTPIQKYAIPAILEGHDLLAIAQTGSGKTAAFLIPIVSRLMGKALKLRQPRTLEGEGLRDVQPLVLVIVPTRELTIQIFDDARRLCYRSMLRPCALYGGASSRSQFEFMSQGCDILIATPGRLYDFLSRGHVSLTRLKHIVLDEADRLLDTEEEALKNLLKNSENAGGDEVQISMFSATFPDALHDLATDHLSDLFVNLRIGSIGQTSDHIKQDIIYVENEDKLQKLKDLLYNNPPNRTLVFVNTKRLCDFIDDKLHNASFPVTSIHSDRTQREREDALLSFRKGRTPVMVATDVAARGLDIRGVMHVINYELPNCVDDYIHRIGRTARIGNPGLATTFFNGENDHLADDLARLLSEHNQEIPSFIAQHEE